MQFLKYFCNDLQIMQSVQQIKFMALMIVPNRNIYTHRYKRLLAITVRNVILITQLSLTILKYINLDTYTNSMELTFSWSRIPGFL
jgi:hypothetical protein